MKDAEFEKNLRYLLRPQDPTADLQQRIEDELGSGEVHPQMRADALPRASGPGLLSRLFRDFGWACAGAAAALAVLVAVHGRRAPTPPTADRSIRASALSAAADQDQPTAFEHDETTHELIAAENSDQLVETDDGPAREVRYSYVERHAWSNPQTGAQVVLEVPREDVYLLPVSLE
jgi:hypothetical protein